MAKIGCLFPTKEAEALFSDQLTKPKAWAIRAQILRMSAGALEDLWRRDEERVKRGGKLTECPYVLACLTASMLNGMSLECLAKAIIAAQHRKGPDEFLKKIRRHRHRLVPLLEHAGVTPSDEERELAERLTTLIEWMGRYPAPLKADGMRVGVPARIEDLPLIAVRKPSSRLSSRIGHSSRSRSSWLTIPLCIRSISARALPATYRSRRSTMRNCSRSERSSRTSHRDRTTSSQRGD